MARGVEWLSHFRIDGGVSRRRFFLVGLVLFWLKWFGDFMLTWGFADSPVPPWAYLNPALSLRFADLGARSPVLLPLLLLYSIPFVWVGVVMFTRRSVDAGFSPWVALLFFLPVINWLVIVWLCLAPSRPSEEQPSLESVRVQWKDALVSLGLTIVLGVLMTVIGTFGAQKYSSALFMGAPFLLGVTSGYHLNRRGRVSVEATVQAVVLGVTAVGGALLLFALEGVLCLAMAALLAYPLAILGALFGRGIASRPRQGGATYGMFLLWPGLALTPGSLPTEVQSVSTSIEVNAPPEVVFPNVVGFSELPPPASWIFHTGIAYPLRAKIFGSGVGAVRHCEFSTGPFVEPITVWDAPHRLAFDVSSEPPSMQEWSPYRVVHAPHLVGGMHSVRGEFLLTPLPGGRTRLVGTTWYELRFGPRAFWSVFADGIVHAIHGRVLEHVRRLSEER